MKKFLAVLVVIGLCGLYWFGCQKKQATEPAAPEVGMEQPAAVIPPPPPPVPEAPAPEAEEEKTE